MEKRTTKKTLREYFPIALGFGALITACCVMAFPNGCSKETSKQIAPAKTEPAAKAEKEAEIKIEEKFDRQWNWVVIEVRTGRNDIELATYFYEIDNGSQSLYYENKRGDTIVITTDKDNNLVKVKVLDKYYHCSDPENANLCKKATEKFRYWETVLNWHERVPRVLKAYGVIPTPPEDYLD